MQWFRVDLKTFLGLAMPNQCSQTVRKQYQAGFGEIILGQNLHTFVIRVLPHYMKSKEIRVVAYTCRYSSGLLIPNTATAIH